MKESAPVRTIRQYEAESADDASVTFPPSVKMYLKYGSCVRSCVNKQAQLILPIAVSVV